MAWRRASTSTVVTAELVGRTVELRSAWQASDSDAQETLRVHSAAHCCRPKRNSPPSDGASKRQPNPRAPGTGADPTTQPDDAAAAPRPGHGAPGPRRPPRAARAPPRLGPPRLPLRPRRLRRLPRLLTRPPPLRAPPPPAPPRHAARPQRAPPRARPRLPPAPRLRRLPRPLVRAAAALLATTTASSASAGRSASPEAEDAWPLAASAHGAALRRGHAADPHVQSGLVAMYAALGDAAAARAAFAEIPRPDVVCATAMVGALAAAGDVDAARDLFDGMPVRDHVSWNTMIAGYVHVGRSREALRLFDQMREAGAAVGEATLVSVLTACAQTGALDRGRWVHWFVHRSGMRMSVTLGTAFVDMYSKCGALAAAMEVFDSMRERNVYTWTSAISGLAMNGMGTECLDLFKRMDREGLQPNGVTFVAMLRGCSMAGLVDEGRACFDSMKDKHGVDPWLEHYGCMVDLYGRAGRLDDAVSFINTMPVEPHEGVWGALLNASRIHNNVELGKYAMDKLMAIESENDAAHVLLSNIYAESKDWKGVSRTRGMMKAKGVKKVPGWSAIEADGKVHEFYVGGKTHPRYKEIEMMIAEMNRRLRLQGYAANTKEVLFDIEEEEKEGVISLHSEKLALAFGLIVLPEGVEIRIVKNLRVCRDCHDYTKMISKVFNREIVMRDRNRFHHFKDGVCTCRDYW